MASQLATTKDPEEKPASRKKSRRALPQKPSSYPAHLIPFLFLESLPFTPSTNDTNTQKTKQSD